MEETKPKINVKRFSRSKSEDLTEPIIEKKTKPKKKVSIVEQQPIEREQPIEDETGGKPPAIL